MVLWAGLIFYLSSIPSLRIDVPDVWDLILRKMAHLFEYGVFAVLLMRYGEHRYPHHWSIPLVSLLGVLIYASVDEIHQTFVDGRVGSVADVGIDFTGGLLAALVYYRWRRKRLT